MINKNNRLLIFSSILSSVFGLIIILLTVYHNFTVKQMLNNLKQNK